MLLAALALTLCAACDSGAPPEADGSTEAPGQKTLELSFTDFVLVRSDTGSKEETDVALQLRHDVDEICGESCWILWDYC